MSKHTPKPWISAPTGDIMKGYSQPFGVGNPYKGTLVCGCFGDISGGEEVSRANARLIAAAPDLLEALRNLVKCHDDWNADVQKIIGRLVNWSPAYLDDARSAIAKAEGV